MPLRFGPGSGLPPFDDELWMSVSKDGRTFDEPRLITEHASSPDVLVLPNGTVLVYCVDFSGMRPGNPERLIVLSSTTGEAWTRRPVVVVGSKSLRPSDPDAALLPDGSTRLHYLSTSADAMMNLDTPHEILSAVSRDGVSFMQEPGVRLRMSSAYDPDVVSTPGGKWRMYFSHRIMENDGPGGGTVRSASSTDGRLFTHDSGARLPVPGSPGAVTLPDGRVRLFVERPDGIGSYLSRNGDTFVFEGLAARNSEDRLLGDPSIARFPDGRFVLVYRRSPPLPTSLRDRFFTAPPPFR